MREIKFRVWCEFEINGRTEKSMESPASWFLMTQTGKLWTYDPGEVPQPISAGYKKAIKLFYIELNDFDENEIYDGDILEFYNAQYTKEKMEVQWINSDTHCGWNVSSAFIQSGNARIVGNRYENPELLEKKKCTSN